MNKYIIFEPSTLQFNITLLKQTYTNLKLRNVSDERLAFKVKTTCVQRYSVRPSCAVIAPGNSLDVTFGLKAFSTPPPDLNNCRDRFQILVAPLSVIVRGNDTTVETDAHGNPVDTYGYPSVPDLWNVIPEQIVSREKLPVVLNMTEETLPPTPPPPTTFPSYSHTPQQQEQDQQQNQISSSNDLSTPPTRPVPPLPPLPPPPLSPSDTVIKLQEQQQRDADDTFINSSSVVDSGTAEITVNSSFTHTDSGDVDDVDNNDKDNVLQVQNVKTQLDKTKNSMTSIAARALSSVLPTKADSKHDANGALDGNMANNMSEINANLTDTATNAVSTTMTKASVVMERALPKSTTTTTTTTKTQHSTSETTAATVVTASTAAIATLAASTSTALPESTDTVSGSEIQKSEITVVQQKSTKTMKGTTAPAPAPTTTTPLPPTSSSTSTSSPNRRQSESKSKESTIMKSSPSRAIQPDYNSVEHARQLALSINALPQIKIPKLDKETRHRVAVERAGELSRVIDKKISEIRQVEEKLVEARHRLGDARLATRPAYDVHFEISESGRVPIAQICIMAIISGVLLQLLI